ncbi:2-oxoglutarate and iron-dependent oxygenase domain-containing protein [Maricaulis sp.]|uniref:isopenicillin N synthase family dioxygenase n=1 Tax=Maricaulis sp. TaxID=1486257 RepID=UPI00261FED94|nr:2-oxoglutarate and iron-dependent oxygenase domain-containing protein [Maricaulis sp.]
MTATDSLTRFPPVSMKLQKSDPKAFAHELGKSFREYGFAAIADHGLDQALIDRAYEVAAKFFALPEETKMKYFIEKGGGARGYTPFGTEIAKDAQHVDLKEFWHVGRDLPAGHPYEKDMAPNVVPEEVEEWVSVIHALYAAFDELGKDVLRAIATDLGLEENFFEDTVRDGNSVMRLLHYPPVQGDTGGSIRAEAHGDINTITLLLGADEPGLQVMTRDGEWVDMNPPAGCLAVNMGDMLSRSTNGVLPSTQHRVINPKGARTEHSRYSMPFFLHYRPDYLIETLPGCEREGVESPEPITAHDFLHQRLKEIGLM